MVNINFLVRKNFVFFLGLTAYRNNLVWELEKTPHFLSVPKYLGRLATLECVRWYILESSNIGYLHSLVDKVPFCVCGLEYKIPICAVLMAF